MSKASMKMLVVGGGGREHALVWKLAQSPHVDQIFCAPGNGGTAQEPKCRNVPIKADDIESLVKFAEEHRPDLTVVGPELPLVKGIVDQWPKGLRIWGPNARCARLEGSKVYAKKLMQANNIPTARFEVCNTLLGARNAIVRFPKGRCVVKADGLCGGKGSIPCQDSDEAEKAAYGMLIEKNLGEAGKQIVIEEYLDGWETSLQVLCAGGQVIPLATAQDYKRIGDGDTGPNTGGMGSYSPVERFTEALLKESLDIARRFAVFESFSGVLYLGLMVTEEGPFVLEFNVRFGDPESKVVLPRLKADLFELLYGGAEGKFPTTTIEWAFGVTVTVVMAAEGYPDKPRVGDAIVGLDRVAHLCPDATVFHAGTTLDDEGRVVTNGGRVLNITATDGTKKLARMRAYRAIREISWPGVQYRTDIAK